MTATLERPPIAPTRTTRRWSNAEFEKLVAQGFFHEQRVELMDGEIIAMSPMMELHARGISSLEEQIYTRLWTPELIVRPQMPFYAGEGHRPEPDVVIVRRTDLPLVAPPSSALLLVAVSDSTLAYDRTDKNSLYASIGVADYWILNLPDRTLEVRRQPMPDSVARHGWNYSQIQTFRAGEAVAPLFSPQNPIDVSDVLPQ